ncbi:hypothetical protein PAXINDRAFT_20547 [Paxillus involutus ATCC 200175]|uniref:Uncharacterized protein n=1 Tax=Paxillus involutus ATCC 200175 TaxID=664439 RepID=A0A0C9TG54_PAXIN|nr:hypothetical protein PAXINDRAFT_20547 [Paxillus involutus ATCC 200175]
MSFPRFAPTLAQTTVPMASHSSTLAIEPIIAHCNSALTPPPYIIQMSELAGDIPLGENTFNPAQPSGMQANPEHDHCAQPPQDSVVDAIMAYLHQIPLEIRAPVLNQCMARLRQDVVRPNGDHGLSLSSRDTSDRSLQKFRSMHEEVPPLLQPGVTHRTPCWSGDVWTGTSSARTPSNEISDIVIPRMPSNGSQVPSVLLTNWVISQQSHALRGSHDAHHPVETLAQHLPLGSSDYLTHTNPPNSARDLSAAHVRHGQSSPLVSDSSGYIPRMTHPVTGTLPFTPRRRGRHRHRAHPSSEFPRPKKTCSEANCGKLMLPQSISRHIREVHEGKKREHPQR